MAFRATRISGGLGYQLHVAAPDVASAVQSIGGWIFDQARAGWTVSILVLDCPDERPLRILGADILELDGAIAMHAAQPDTFSLAVAAELYNGDKRFRHMVDRGLKDKHTMSSVWGQTCPTHLADQLDAVTHTLSGAACAFKAHALRAAHANPKVGPTETLFSDAVTSYATVRHS
jgi:hypothetical protein